MLISQKGGRISTSIFPSHRQPLDFDANYPKLSLDKQKKSPYNSTTKKEVLINY